MSMSIEFQNLLNKTADTLLELGEFVEKLDARLAVIEDELASKPEDERTPQETEPKPKEKKRETLTLDVKEGVSLNA